MVQRAKRSWIPYLTVAGLFALILCWWVIFFAHEGDVLIERLNALRGDEYPLDADMAARVASYELAFRMQRSVPEVVDFSGETAETKSLYGLNEAPCRSFGMQLLAARRFVERGVRFIQIQHGAGGAGSWWDRTAGSPARRMRRSCRDSRRLARRCARVSSAAGASNRARSR